jgi:hypothetical protein
MENGDASITCGALDIDGNRVMASNEQNEIDIKRAGYKDGANHVMKANKDIVFNVPIAKNYDHNSLAFTKTGRYPAQAFIDSGIALRLDAQSGVLTSGETKSTHKVNTPLDEKGLYQSPNGCYNKFKPQRIDTPSSSGGCSKILHKCDYEEIDFDFFMYCAKVSKTERNLGCKENNHPTLKPISLLLQVLKLFKTPNKQVVLDCFMGSGSIGIAAQILDMDFIGIELDAHFFEIAEKRTSNVDLYVKFLADKEKSKKTSEPKIEKPSVKEKTNKAFAQRNLTDAENKAREAQIKAQNELF